MMESLSHNESRRRFSRIDVYIPVEFRKISEEEQQFVKARISGEVIQAEFKLAPSLKNHPHLGWINALNKKIDSVIQKLMLEYEGFHSLGFKYVTISAGGMGFSSATPFALGDLLEIKMLLSLHNPVALYLYGEVVKIGKQTSGHYIAVAFRRLDENIQDRIVRYVFEMERELLRTSRKA